MVIRLRPADASIADDNDPSRSVGDRSAAGVASIDGRAVHRRCPLIGRRVARPPPPSSAIRRPPSAIPFPVTAVAALRDETINSTRQYWSFETIGHYIETDSRFRWMEGASGRSALFDPPNSHFSSPFCLPLVFAAALERTQHNPKAAVASGIRT